MTEEFEKRKTRKRRRPRGEIDDARGFRKTPHIDYVQSEKLREPLLGWPEGSDKEKYSRRHRYLARHTREKRRRRKSVGQIEAPNLSKSVVSLRAVSIPPRVKPGKMSRLP